MYAAVLLLLVGTPLPEHKPQVPMGIVWRNEENGDWYVIMSYHPVDLGRIKPFQNAFYKCAVVGWRIPYKSVYECYFELVPAEKLERLYRGEEVRQEPEAK